MTVSTHHRLAHYEMGGNIFGSKLAAVSMDARSAKAASGNLLRKVVVTRLHDMSVADFNELLANGAGAVLFLLPPGMVTITIYFLRFNSGLSP